MAVVLEGASLRAPKTSSIRREGDTTGLVRGAGPGEGGWSRDGTSASSSGESTTRARARMKQHPTSLSTQAPRQGLLDPPEHFTNALILSPQFVAKAFLKKPDNKSRASSVPLDDVVFTMVLSKREIPP